MHKETVSIELASSLLLIAMIFEKRIKCLTLNVFVHDMPRIFSNDFKFSRHPKLTVTANSALYLNQE